MHPPRKAEPKSIIINKLGLDEAQVIAYTDLIQEHRSSIDKEEALTGTIKRELYSYLKSEVFISPDSLLQQLGNQQIRIEQIHFNHFLALKNLCKKDQIPAFNELTAELEDIFSRKPPQGRKR
jgi:periplasmic protein CpxP/Spy